MTDFTPTKKGPYVAISSVGTGLGTSSVLDTSGFQNMQLMAFHAGTGGSRVIKVHVNGGTQIGTSSTAFPNPIFVGSAKSDYAGAGSITWHCGSLTKQAIIEYGTSSDSSFSVTYELYE